MDVAQCSAILCLATLVVRNAVLLGRRQGQCAHGAEDVGPRAVRAANWGWLAVLVSLGSCTFVVWCITAQVCVVWGQTLLQLCPIPEGVWWQVLLWGSYLSTLQSYRYLGRFPSHTTASRRWAECHTAFTLSYNMLLWIAGFSGVAVCQILAVSFWLWPSLKVAQTSPAD